MSAYAPPSMPIDAIFNTDQWPKVDDSTAALSGYVTLNTTQTVPGFKTFNTGIKTGTVYNMATDAVTMPATAGTFALTSQLPTNLDYVDLTTNQTVGGNKSFNDDVSVGGAFDLGPSSTFSISNPSSLVNLQYTTASGTYNLVIPGQSSTLATLADVSGGYVALTGNQTVSGEKTFNDKIIAADIASALQYHPTLTSTIYSNAGGDFILDTNGSQAAIISSADGASFAGGVSTFSSPMAAFGLSLAGNRSISNSTYLDGMTLNLASASFTDGVSSGTVAQATDVRIGAKTLLASAPTTYTNAASLRIASAPVASTNVTITNPYALQIDSGNVSLLNGAIISGANGSASNPVYSVGGVNTGMYAGAANQLNLTVSGSNKITITTGSTQSSQQFRLTSGSAGTPGCAFTSDSTSGLYLVGAGNPALSVAGTQLVNWTATRESLIAGSATTPSLGFSTDTGTGWYRPAANQLGAAVSGVNVTTTSSTGLNVAGKMTATTAQIGTNGTTVATAMQFGQFTTTTVLTAGSSGQIGTISLTGFSAIPNISLTIGSPSAGLNNWDRVIPSIRLQGSTSSSVIVDGVNTSSGGSTGDTAIVYWRAIA